MAVTLAAINLIPDLNKGDVLKCGTCKNFETVEHKHTLPAGWVILQWRVHAGLTQRVVCPECDAKETERWSKAL
jgi:hypothetical protein